MDKTMDLRPPIRRSWLRLRLGKAYYTGKRYLLWCSPKYRWAKIRREERLPCVQFSHATPLMRHLRGEEMAWQENKVTNLNLAVKRLDGLILHPGETFSYWKLIGKPTARKGYKEGMVLFLGQIGGDIGGGLCQLSNLIFWMTLHTPLTVTERYRHSHDVFPDANRTQPFGSGATCAYPHRDLMIRNDTDRRISCACGWGRPIWRGHGIPWSRPLSASGFWNGMPESTRPPGAAISGTTSFGGRCMACPVRFWRSSTSAPTMPS